MKAARYADSHATSVREVEDWRERAACLGHDPELWFADAKDQNSRSRYEFAKAICGSCPVRGECLDEALEEEARPGRASRYGIRGGLTANERSRRAGRKGRASGRPAKGAAT